MHISNILLQTILSKLPEISSTNYETLNTSQISLYVFSNLSLSLIFLLLLYFLIKLKTQRSEINFPKAYFFLMGLSILTSLFFFLEGVLFIIPGSVSDTTFRLIIVVLSSATLIGLLRVFPQLVALKTEKEYKATLQKQKLTEIKLHKAHDDEMAFANSLNQLVEELRHSNKEIEQFAYLASHDLQEPLRAVTKYIQGFEKHQENNIDSTSTQYLSLVKDSIQRMHFLVEDLLEYSRVGKKEDEMIAIDCNKLLDIVLEDLSATIDENHASIRYESLPVINGYFVEMKSLFQNLISNSIKFRKSGSIPVLNISAIAQGKEWIFSVKDNGIGLKNIYYDKIFNIFQRLHTQDEYPGNGIGLAQCKKIIEMHHGNIWVESELDSGSVFYFTIPILPSINNN